jgi:hypothetical protein
MANPTHVYFVTEPFDAEMNDHCPDVATDVKDDRSALGRPRHLMVTVADPVRFAPMTVAAFIMTVFIMAVFIMGVFIMGVFIMGVFIMGVFIMGAMMVTVVMMIDPVTHRSPRRDWL